MSITSLNIIIIQYVEMCGNAIETINVLRGNQHQIILKEEQEVAVKKLLLGQDVLTILPTGKREMGKVYRICSCKAVDERDL